MNMSMSMSMSSEEMCSFYCQSMGAGSTVQGDLTDIVLGGSRSSPAPGGFLASTGAAPTGSGQLPELSAKGCLSPAPVMQQVVLPPRAPGVKKRKGQTRRVICIPAPASSAADQEGSNKSSTGGVVVPSDLWAWRKYGQKPIKGSPYPRGYYRCSSSKGCSARKQVERSCSDPNMLVITYTSEHNHPWPTRRNSLAGSTRSSSSSSHPSKSQKNTKQPSPSISKQEAHTDMPMLASTPHIEAIKEENLDFDMVFNQSYAPMMLESKDVELFDELGLYPDPMSFFFSSRELKLEEEGDSNKGLDPLIYFDNWDGN